MRAYKSHAGPLAVSDEFWSMVEPLLPLKMRSEGKPFRRRPGAGRKPVPARRAFEAIVHVLRTGAPWKSLPPEFGSASALHRRFDAWHASGLFWKIWHLGLAEHEEMEGIAWQWTLDHCTPAHTPARGARHGTPGVCRRDWEPANMRRRARTRLVKQAGEGTIISG